MYSNTPSYRQVIHLVEKAQRFQQTQVSECFEYPEHLKPHI